MRIVKSDPRYRAEAKFKFSATVVPAAWLVGGRAPPRPRHPQTPELRVPGKQVGVVGIAVATIAAVGSFLAEHPLLATVVVVGLLATAGLAMTLVRRRE
jgi:hypothetical protein